jgi:hypothetical protein
MCNVRGAVGRKRPSEEPGPAQGRHGTDDDDGADCGDVLNFLNS